MAKKEEYFEWICPVCGKKIKSLYLNQFNQNKDQHKKTHEKKNGK